MQFFGFFENHMWIAEVVIGIVVLIIANLILTYVLKLIKRKSSPSEDNWKKRIVIIFHSPLKFLLWVIGLSFLIKGILSKFQIDNVIHYIDITRSVLIVIGLSWLLIRWKKEIENIILKKGKKLLDRSSLDFLSKIINIIIIFIALLIILQMMGLNIMPLVAFGGIGAGAVALAAKDVIANFFGGLMIYITRPFSKGDLVDIPNQNIYGVVEQIGWYNTSVREFSKVPIYIPNSTFSNNIIKNNSRRTHRKIDETIAMRYSDFSKLEIIIQKINSLLKNDENIDKDQALNVYFTTFSDYSLKVSIRCYSKLTGYQDFMNLKQNLLMNIQNIITSEGAQMPFPTTSVDILNNKQHND